MNTIIFLIILFILLLLCVLNIILCTGCYFNNDKIIKGGINCSDLFGSPDIVIYGMDNDGSNIDDDESIMDDMDDMDNNVSISTISDSIISTISDSIKSKNNDSDIDSDSDSDSDIDSDKNTFVRPIHKSILCREDSNYNVNKDLTEFDKNFMTDNKINNNQINIEKILYIKAYINKNCTNNKNSNNFINFKEHFVAKNPLAEEKISEIIDTVTIEKHIYDFLKKNIYIINILFGETVKKTLSNNIWRNNLKILTSLNISGNDNIYINNGTKYKIYKLMNDIIYNNYREGDDTLPYLYDKFKKIYDNHLPQISFLKLKNDQIFPILILSEDMQQLWNCINILNSNEIELTKKYFIGLNTLNMELQTINSSNPQNTKTLEQYFKDQLSDQNSDWNKMQPILYTNETKKIFKIMKLMIDNKFNKLKTAKIIPKEELKKYLYDYFSKQFDSVNQNREKYNLPKKSVDKKILITDITNILKSQCPIWTYIEILLDKGLQLTKNNLGKMQERNKLRIDHNKQNEENITLENWCRTHWDTVATTEKTAITPSKQPIKSATTLRNTSTGTTPREQPIKSTTTLRNTKAATPLNSTTTTLRNSNTGTKPLANGTINIEQLRQQNNNKKDKSATAPPFRF